MKMNRIVWWIWGFPQNLVGLIMASFFEMKAQITGVEMYKDSKVFYVISKFSGAVSLGTYIFIFSDYGRDKEKIIMHEYGHSIQSKILGPLYLLVIGLPSIIWAGLFEKYRNKHKISYYSLFTEKGANKLVGLSEKDF